MKNKIIVIGFIEQGTNILVSGYEKFKDSKEYFDSVLIAKESIIDYCKGLYPELIEQYMEPDARETEGYYLQELFLDQEAFFDTGLDFRIIQEYMTEKSVLENLEETKQSA